MTPRVITTMISSIKVKPVVEKTNFDFVRGTTSMVINILHYLCVHNDGSQ